MSFRTFSYFSYDKLKRITPHQKANGPRYNHEKAWDECSKQLDI